eukprot:SAG31_NODE_820_length_11808_cov_16.331540_5_plen_169_part_00
MVLYLLHLTVAEQRLLLLRKSKDLPVLHAVHVSQMSVGTLARHPLRSFDVHEHLGVLYEPECATLGGLGGLHCAGGRKDIAALRQQSDVERTVHCRQLQRHPQKLETRCWVSTARKLLKQEQLGVLSAHSSTTVLIHRNSVPPIAKSESLSVTQKGKFSVPSHHCRRS